MKFKKFMESHPKLKDEIKKRNSTLQDLYEEWYLFGEDDSHWLKYKENQQEINKDKVEDQNNKKTGWIENVLSIVKDMDPHQIQQHLQHLNEALGAVQGILSQFQTSEKAPQKAPDSVKTSHPFMFRKD